ncbi:MAG: hypothetical protein VZS44_10840 [Bacilli bacterium]|nr:hypothetical protein [Bacilli bacterium]
MNATGRVYVVCKVTIYYGENTTNIDESILAVCQTRKIAYEYIKQNENYFKKEEDELNKQYMESKTSKIKKVSIQLIPHGTIYYTNLEAD